MVLVDDVLIVLICVFYDVLLFDCVETFFLRFSPMKEKYCQFVKLLMSPTTKRVELVHESS